MDNASTVPVKRKKARLEKTYWGYIFIAPFFVVYLLFSAYPIFATFYYAFSYREITEDYISNDAIGEQLKPYSEFKFVGLDNFYFSGPRERYFFDNMDYAVKPLNPPPTKGGFLANKKWTDAFLNTALIWVVGFIPQLGLALLFASWFTDAKIRVKGQGFFKVIFYMPNIMTAATIGYMFYVFAQPNGFFHVIAQNLGVIQKITAGGSSPALAGPVFSRGMVAFINFWMWFGNTMIVLVAGILGINPSLFEAANIDGANGSQTFWKITIPLIRPILTFNLVQSLIGGMQMYDVPRVMSGITSSPHGNYIATIMTQVANVAYLGGPLGAQKSFGEAAAAAVLLFIITTIASVIIFQLMKDRSEDKYLRKQKQKMKLQQAGGGY